MNRCPSQRSHLQPSLSPCTFDFVLPALCCSSVCPCNLPVSPHHLSSQFCVKGGLQGRSALSFLIFPDLQKPPELSASSCSHIFINPPPSVVPTCLDQSSQGGLNPGENTPSLFIGIPTYYSLDGDNTKVFLQNSRAKNQHVLVD